MQQKIIVQLFNGLGNQLFQYAAGRWLAKRLGAALKLIHQGAGSERTRPLLLQRFALEVGVHNMSALDRLTVTAKPKFQLASRFARRARRIQLFQQDPDKIAQPFEFLLDESARSIYLAGYFQEHRIVRGVEQALRRELVLLESLEDPSQHYAELISSKRQPISVHLRRGDYLTAFGPRSVLPASYYERAIERMRSRFADPHFFVFSDDIAFARSWARSFSNATVVDCNDASLAHECMYLMSLCRHHIIANSTFSWWGAWLNPRRDKQVIAPDTWLGLDTRAARVSCPEWELIPAHHLPPVTQERGARRAFA